MICAPQAEIEDLLGKGRVFLFLYKPSEKNYATGETHPESFTLYFYFLVPGFYNRIELAMRRSEFTVKPDYLRRYFDQKMNTLSRLR